MRTMTNLFDLSGKVALITGGNGGVGLGFAKALADHGADIAIWGTNEAKNAAAKAELEATGRRVLALRCDVGNHDEVHAAMDETVGTMGRLDACFVNSGVPGAGKCAPSTIPMRLRRA